MDRQAQNRRADVPTRDASYLDVPPCIYQTMDISDRPQSANWRLFLDDVRPARCARSVTARSTAGEQALPPTNTHAAFSTLPRLGVFWALPIAGEGWDVVTVSRPFGEVPQIGGFRTLEAGHVDLWPRIRRQTSPEVIGEYEDYPRGRVNWREEDQRFLLLLDPTLRRPSWVARVMALFALPVGSTLIMTDPHYRAKRKPPIEAPQVETGEH